MVNVFLCGTVSNSNVSGSVGPVASTIVSANRKRMSVTLVNDGDENVYLSLDATAIANKGIRLNAGGGSYEINGTNLFQGTISAVTKSGTTGLTLMEMSTEV